MKSRLSPAARARISAAQKKRWAKVRAAKAAKKTPSAPVAPPDEPRYQVTIYSHVMEEGIVIENYAVDTLGEVLNLLVAIETSGSQDLLEVRLVRNT